MDITRPRISAVEPSWTVLLAVAIAAMLANPSGTSTTASSSGLGATAAISDVTPKAVTDHSSTLRVGRALLAVTRAPTTEPQAIMDASSPYRLGPPSKVKRASSGSATRKFSPNVATIAISTSVDRNVGVAHAYR